MDVDWPATHPISRRNCKRKEIREKRGSISGRWNLLRPVLRRRKLKKICLPTRLSPAAIYAIYPPINWSNSIRDPVPPPLAHPSCLVASISFENRFDPEPENSITSSSSPLHTGRKPIPSVLSLSLVSTQDEVQEIKKRSSEGWKSLYCETSSVS